MTGGSDVIVSTRDETESAPIDAHLAALAARPFPEAALRACVARFDEARRPLRSLLDRAAAGKALTDPEWLSFFRGLHILAAARDAESFASLLRLLRRSPDEVEDLLGDALDVSVHRLVISLFDGDSDALLALVAEPKAHEIVRSALLDAAIYLTWQRRLDREEMHRFLVAFASRRPAVDEAPVWRSWMQAVALLDFRDLVPMVEKAWKAGRIDRTFQEWSDFGKDLARARTAYDDERRFEHLAVGSIDDVVAELEWTRHWETDDGSNAGEEEAGWEQPTPAVNPFRNVGRNDPCPCGSGKKAKKCCLATG